MPKFDKIYITRPNEYGSRPITDADYALSYLQNMRDLYANDLTNLACNSVIIDGLPQHVPHDYVMQVLITCGAVGKPTFADDFYKPCGSDTCDIYGYPKKYLFVAANNKQFYVPSKNAVILKANPLGTPLYQYIIACAEQMAYIDLSIRNNLIATQSTTVFEVENDGQVASVRAAFDKKSIGVPAIIARKDIGEAVKAVPTGAAYIADKLYSLRALYRDEVLQHIGVLTANREKRERVQSAEVSASVGEVVDYIYTMIDTFNADCERYEVPYKMRINAAVENLYTDDTAKTMESVTDEV